MAITYVVEQSLRKKGHQPGTLYPQELFKAVDQLSLHPGFSADEYGITHIDPELRMDFSNAVQSGNLSNLPFNQIESLVKVVKDHHMMTEQEVNGALGERYRQLIQLDSSLLNKIEQHILHYVKNPINESGFRSIPFESDDQNNDSKSILLLGDSFCWGMSAENILQSFADELLGMGYHVYNTGIPATGMSQYTAIAETYLKVLQPDIVILNFYPGNDITNIRFEAGPQQMRFYSANAGNLLNFPRGKHLDAEELFKINMALCGSILNLRSKPLTALLSQSVLGTRFYWLMVDLGIVSNEGLKLWEEYQESTEGLIRENPQVTYYLDRISTVCKENKSNFIISVIPMHPYKKQFTWNPETIFDSFTYHIPQSILPEDYGDKDPHFNTVGHRKYAFFLDSLIRTYSGSELP